MVTDDRAQLVLVGSIAIAVVIIGLTIVLNSAVFTENVAGGSSAEIAGDVTEFDREATRNVRAITIRVSHDTVFKPSGAGGPADLQANLSTDVGNYSSILAETYADTGSIYVNVSGAEVTEFGNRIVQNENDEFSANGGGNTWTTVDEPFVLGWFVVNVDVENVSRSNPAYVELTDSKGTELNISMQQTSGGRLALNASVGGGNVSDVTCTPENGRVLLDVLEGEAYTGDDAGDCSFNTTEYLEPPYTELRFVDGQNGRGKYDIVMNRSDLASLNGVPDCPSLPEPCRSTAAWKVEFTTRYRSSALTYEKTHNVSVYRR